MKPSYDGWMLKSEKVQEREVLAVQITSLDMKHSVL